MENVYVILAEALGRLPNKFPRTTSGIEIELLKHFFSTEEAALAVHLSGEMTPIEEIASRAGLNVAFAQDMLQQMSSRGLVNMDEQMRVKLATFFPGFYYAHGDHTLAHMFSEYMAAGGAEKNLGSDPAYQRVVPARAATKSEWIMPYDDIRSVLDSMKTFYLVDCECRMEEQMLGHTCKFPTRTCLSFSPTDDTPVPYNITKEEALALLDRAEEIGLVHTVSNWSNGYSFVCNCCGCCCKLLRAINELGIEKSVAQANYYAVIDPDLCSNCGTCVERCQVKAISEIDGVSVVDRKRCIGCGLCVTGCPNGVARLEQKPEAEVIIPPVDYSAWEHRRLHAS